MNFIKSFFGNYMLMSAIGGWFVAQVIKIIISLCRREKTNYFKLLFSTGGMPSSHTASVVGLSTGALVLHGVGSPYFAITCIFAMVVMTDASGVRYETGEQAKILNKITKELFSGKAEEINTGLKELVGHTPFQVAMGAVTGILVSVALGFIMGVI